MNFQLNDRVKVVKNVTGLSYYDQYIGDIGVIEQIDFDCCSTRYTLSNNNIRLFYEEELELVKKNTKMKNMWEVIAKEYGVEIGEEFKLLNEESSPGGKLRIYKITETGGLVGY